MKGRLFRKKRIGGNTREQIDEKVDRRAMAGVFYLTYIFEEVVDRFNDRAFAQKNFIFGQLIFKNSPLHTAIKMRYPNADFTDKGKYIQLAFRSGFLDINFSFIHHETVVEDGEL